MSQGRQPEFRFKPAAGGLVKVLGPLETQIMQIIWREKSTTVKQVHRRLQEQTGRDIAYTTVMTTMTRLADKGMLHRRRDGLAFVYTPAVTKRDFEQMMVRRVLDGLLDDYEEETVSYVLDYLARRDPQRLLRIQRELQIRQAS
ncbi:BlaI/MecI/CopY family transcriptional regulator [Kallotenue papyrolyticum]|uniref:BlaI/MecI/CopY family transcriptional regulator n=1 Tax=Kallotenue papyrolyticum TaxID=1325125 RepID=UPI0004926345|nr:BlaI/MecI/CopY family transcriptional regulator [Kallotenue papyrolyticum]